MSDIWSRLGIAPTTDQAALRLAYAERLKLVRPDTDPAGFRALREAFEAARRKAGGEASQPSSQPPRPVPPRPQTAGAAADIRARLAEGRLLDAARVWQRAVATGELGFDEEPQLQEEVARAAVGAPDADLATLQEAAGLMRWEEAARALGAPASVVEVMARRAAYAWLGGMQAAARDGWRWSAGARARNRAARLLLRPAPRGLSAWFPYVLRRTDFIFWSRELTLHRRWLGRAIDPARLAWCLAARRRFDARLLARLHQFVVLFTVLSLTATALMTIMLAIFKPR